jgi:hypothetical protein
MRTRATTALTVLLITSLAACSTTPEPDKRAAPAESATAEPTQPASAYALGKSYTWSAENELGSVTGSTTVLSYTQPATGVSPPGDGLGIENPEWAVVEIKVCVLKGDSIMVSQQPWSLAFPDDTRTETTGLNGGDLPKPEFPTLDTTLKSGDCLRGKIPYPVQRGARPDRIVYAPQNEPEPIEWTVPAK